MHKHKHNKSAAAAAASNAEKEDLVSIQQCPVREKHQPPNDIELGPPDGYPQPGHFLLPDTEAMTGRIAGVERELAGLYLARLHLAAHGLTFNSDPRTMESWEDFSLKVYGRSGIAPIEAVKSLIGRHISERELKDYKQMRTLDELVGYLERLLVSPVDCRGNQDLKDRLDRVLGRGVPARRNVIVDDNG